MSELDKELVHVIHHTLQSALSPDKVLIDQAQQELKVLQFRQEYPLILVNLLINQSNDFAIRQLAGVLAKQFIEVHWSQNSDKFQEPEIDQFVKLKIKHLLPIALNDGSSKIRTTVAFAIASIAHWDWPELWPELFGILLTGLSGNLSGTNTIDLNGVHGALETLTEIVQEVTDIQMPQVAPAILPQLYKIFIDPVNFSLDLRNKSVSIFTSLANVVAEMAEYDTTAPKKYLYPYMPDFVCSMINVLSTQETTNLVDYGLKKEVIKSLCALLKAFPKKLTNQMNEILTQVWSCLVQGTQLYVDKVVNSDSNDSEDLKASLEELVYQLFDFILILKEKSKYKSTIKKAIDELCFYAINYMQITDEQIENWTSNPDQFVQDEDEESYSYSVRISGQELIESIASDFSKETVNSLWKTIGRVMENAQKLREANNENWWKLHEACLLALADIKPILQELIDSNSIEFDLNSFFNQFVVASLHESNYPFLVGRALFTASKYPKLLNAEMLNTLLKATGTLLLNNQNPIIQCSAVKATYSFCDELEKENQSSLILPHLPQITEGLMQMIIQNPTNQIGTLSMETLVVVLSIDDQFLLTVESKVSPLAIALFLKNTSDPLVNSIVTDIIKTIISNEYTYKKMEERLVPTLISILNQTLASLNNRYEQKDVSCLLTSTLDLITTTVRSSNQVPLSDLTMSVFIHVINLCLRVDETAILQSGGECLRAYLSKSIDQIINWKDEKGTSALNYIVLVINHMLDPKTSENSCSFIGKLINTLIRQTAHVLGDNLESILKAVLSKIQSSNILLVQQSLIMVFAHLIHSRMDAVLAFLSNLPGPTGKPVLEFLMSEWVSKQNSFVGPYESKISILALAKLLEHAIFTDDKRFQNIFVKGDRIINPIEGIKTRSKAKDEKELYTQVPLLVRIYKLLINELHGLIEEKKEEQEEEYEEEEEFYDEDENDEENDENSDQKDEIDVDENNTEAEHINNYLNKHDLFEEAFDREDLAEDDPDAMEDPLMKIDLFEFLTNYLRTLSQHPYYSHFSEHHNQLEKQVLKEIGISV